jgi:hypothetical protein
LLDKVYSQARQSLLAIVWVESKKRSADSQEIQHDNADQGQSVQVSQRADFG